MKNIYKLVISIIIPFIASAIGGFFTASSVSSWYLKLNKPSFNPPSWIFGPVWSVLYLMMGISLYLVWTKSSDKMAFILFGIQLFLNVLWSFLFFGLKMPSVAFVEIIFLLIAIIITAVYFFKINPVSAYLLIPYILWVCFAAFLNLSIVRLN